MSVITSRSSLLSILKIRNQNQEGRPSLQNRVRFQLPCNVRQIFINKKNQVNTKDYEHLVCTIRDSEISDTDLKRLLEEASNCVGILDFELRLFVQALVILGWTHRSPDVIKDYQSFIINVVSAHPLHAKDVINQLVKLFISCEESDWTEIGPSDAFREHLVNIHVILRSIVKVVPL